MTESVSFGNAFKYPFNRAVGLLNFLWVLVPIVGWLALYGYTIRIIQNFAKGDFKELPLFDFGGNLKLGFWMFLKMIPFIIGYMALQFALGLVGTTGVVASILVGIFIVPMLIINFFVKETIGAYVEFRVIKPVFENFGDYIIAALKSIGLQIIFLLLSIVLVGIPAGQFTKNIFFADFYGRLVAEK
jgi:hypothetical protein